ncbi:Thaumatin-like protein [Drosera capensis]
MRCIINMVSFSLILVFSLIFTISFALTTFNITNNCPYTVWAAAIPVGGGKRLDQGQTWTITANTGTSPGRIWARTGCNVTGPDSLSCLTGDCDGLFQCQWYGQAPYTLAEYSLTQLDELLDYFDISLVDGFNVPLEFLPISDQCTNGPICSADISAHCPPEIQVPGGCINPLESGSCGPTTYSQFFKGLCPNASSYLCDYATSKFTCFSGVNYRIVFCP